MKEPKPYQLEGAEFLASGGVMLADEPGLGKTLQAIEACKLVGARRVLIICPAVALAVWRNEIKDCWPECDPIYLRDRKTVARQPEPFALITGYEYLVVNIAALALVTVHKFDALILDEAHALKNPTSKRTILIYGPGCGRVGGIAELAKHVWPLTGTPQLNHPGEWFPHLRALAPDRITEASYDGYTHHYCTMGVRTVRSRTGRNITIQTIEGANKAAIPELAHRLRGFWLRRRAEQVLTQLPPIRVVTRLLDPDSCDIATVNKMEDSEEAEALREALASSDPAKALQSIEGHVARLRKLFALAKVKATVEWVTDLLDGGVDKVGVWGWHVDALQKIYGTLSADYKGSMIIGSTTKREDEVRRFQNVRDCRFFVGQIQAAGTAITLTAAHRAVFLEQSFVPALNFQAAKRHHRIGQTKPVLVEVLAIDGSIDQAVAEILARKAADIQALESAA